MVPSEKRAHVTVWLGLAASLSILAACGGGGSSRKQDTTPPVSTLTAPVGGEVVSGTQNITWTTVDPNPGSVEIRISDDSGATFAVLLDPAAPDTGSYSVDTTAFPDGNTYRVRIIPTDLLNNRGLPSDSAADFSIDNTAPTVTLTAPVGGEIWGGTRDITWTTNDPHPGTVEILLSDNSGATYATVIAASTADTGSYSWDTTPERDFNTYRIQVTATDLVGNGGPPTASAADFIIDNTAPVTQLLSPLGGESWRGTVGIGWMTTESYPDTVDIHLSTDSGATFTTTLATGVNDLLGLWGWNTTLTQDTTRARIRVTPTDRAGNVGAPAESISDMHVDNTAPVTLLTAPVGRERWFGTQNITWTTTDMLPARVQIDLSSDSGATFPIQITPNDPDTGTYAWDTTAYPDGTTYRIRVSPTDMSGNPGAPAESTFDFEINQTPIVAGFARYADRNRNALADPGDTLIVPFNMDVTLNGAAPTDLVLPVSGDSFGTGATLSPGPAPNEVTVTLGTAPALKSRQTFDAAATLPNDPSGVDVSAAMAPNAIESTALGRDAAPSTPIDVIPEFVNSQGIIDAADSCILLGDVDSDGDLDIVGAIEGGGNTVWRNDGTGAFADTGQSLGSSDTFGAALADVDRDGDLDLIAGNFAQPERIWLNDGTGVFTDSGQALGTDNTSSIATGDVDSDGDIDFACGVLGGGFRVYMNDGSGTFADSGQVTSPTEAFSLVLADIDRDGDLDLVVGNGRAQPNTIWRNDGSGRFNNSGQALGASDTHTIALGDLDADGDLDLVAGNTSGEADTVWRNDGLGNFVAWQAFGSTETFEITLADIDSDGDLDIVTGNFAEANRVWLNDGSAVFADSGQAMGAAITATIALGDLDGDGDLDLVEAGRAGDDVWMNSLSGTWGSATFTDSGQALGGGSTVPTACGDVDSDGDLDIIAGNMGGQPNRVWLNDGAAAFTDSGQTLASMDTYSLALGDLDSDGDLDVVEGNLPGQPNLVWLNDGAGTFIDSAQLLGIGDTYALALGDLDADGDLDLVEGNFNGQPNRIWLNDGAGIFTDSGQALGSGRTYSVALGDVDGDGDLDFVAGNDAQANRVWLNDGSANFTDSGQTLGNGATAAVALADVDGDGDLDLVTGNFTEPNRVWRNDGMGTFTDSLQTLGNGATFDLEVGDVDGDGDLDFVATNTQGEADRLWLNDGAGIFSDSGQVLGTTESYSVILDDLDRDGDLDYAVGTALTSPNRVWTNE